MTDLRAAIAEYISIRRALGFEMRNAATALQRFVTFAETEAADFITTELALRWARQPNRTDGIAWSVRLGIVRRFARFRAATDSRTEVPPAGLLPYRYHRKPPYLYSHSDLERLIAAAKLLASPKGLRAQTFVTLLGLHAVTGLRAGEGVRLDQQDVDLDRDLLWISRTKFGKSRWVPIHPTTAYVLRRYARHRDRIFPKPRTAAFFVTEKGVRLPSWTVRATFPKLVRRAGLARRVDSRAPRLHDFRHSFAVATLLRWYRSGADVERRMPVLSTYLGHTNVVHTYWYLSATPELLRLAARLVETPAGGRSR